MLTIDLLLAYFCGYDMHERMQPAIVKTALLLRLSLIRIL